MAWLHRRQTKKGARVLRRDGGGHGVGLVLNFGGISAVKMLFWSAVVNGLLAPPLILLFILLTSDTKVMGRHVNPPLHRYLGWVTFVDMVAAAAGMIITS